VDYEPLSGTVVIPPGQTSWSVPINVFNDNIAEGVETIIISITNSCSCSSLEIEVEIHDPPPVNATLPNFELCEATPLSLQPTVSGGIPNQPFTYSWSTGGNTPLLTVVPTSNTSYTVTVTDDCGGTATATSNVTVTPLPTAIISGTGLLCSGSTSTSIDITVSFTGVGPWQFVLLKDGVPQPPITTSVNPYVFQTNTTGTWQLESVLAVQGNCPGAVGGIASIVVNNLSAAAVTTPSGCNGDGTMTVTPSGGAPAYTYLWSNGAPNQPTATGLTSGTYTVTITDNSGCTATASSTVLANLPVTASASAPTPVTCSNPTGGSINVVVAGGAQPYTFQWSNGIGNVQNPTGLTAGTYQVTVVDNSGCTATAQATVVEDITPPTAVGSATSVINCQLPNAGVSGQGSSFGNNFSYQWSGPGVIGGGSSLNATVNQPGVYTLTVTNTSNGCTASAVAIVEANLETPVAIAVGGELSCSTTQINLNGSLSTPGGIQYAWTGPGIISGASTANPLVNAAGVYTLTVTNPVNGCTNSTPAVVSLNNVQPVANISNPQQLSCSVNSVLLNGSGSSSGTNYSSQWFFAGNAIPGATNNTHNASAAGTYQIVVTNQDNGCTSSYAVQLTEDLAPPSIGATANGQITCTISSVVVNGSVNGNNANFAFAWSTPNGIILNGANEISATVGAPGTYLLTVTSLINGCTATTSVQVTQDASIPEVEIGPAAALNCLTAQLQLNGSNSSQGSSLTYSWTTQGGNIVSGQNTLTPVVNAPGVYTLTIFDSSNNCENTGSITISQDIAAPAITMPAAPLLTCAVTTTQLNASVNAATGAVLSYQWSTSNGNIQGPGNVLNPVISAAGTYNLTVANQSNGCTATATITATANTAPPVVQIASPATLTCATDSVTLNGAGSSTGSQFSYQWSTASGSISAGATTLQPTVNAPGSYSLVITNSANGCTAASQVSVSENILLPTANAGLPDTLTCADEQLVLSGNGSTGSQFIYNWTGPGIVSGSNSLSPLINQPGAYTLLVTNVSNACTATASVAISQDIEAPVAVAGPGGQLSCTMTSLSLDGAGSSTGNNISYLWVSENGFLVNGQNSLTPQVNAPGLYEIIVTNLNNGCTASDLVTVTQDAGLPTVDAGTSQPITCLVSAVTLDGSGSSNGAGFSYQWSTSNGNIVSGANTLNPVVNAAGIYVLTVVNTATSCTSLGSVTVQSLTAPPAAEAGISQTLTCTTTSLALQGNGSATGSDITYLWSTANGNIASGSNTLNPTIDQPGNYTLLVTNTATGCSNTDQVLVTEDLTAPQAAIATPGTLTCTTISLALNGSGSSNGNNFSYQWSTPNGNIVSGAGTSTPTINQPGIYTLTITNLINGCSSSAQTAVAQNNQAPVAEAGIADQLNCTLQSLSLNGAGSDVGTNFTYLWNTANGNILTGVTTLTPVINQPGTYTLQVTNLSNGCTATDQVGVTQDVNLPQIVINSPGVLTCLVKELNLSASVSQGQAFSYGWTTQNGNIVSGGSALSPLINAPGVYLLTVTNSANGCTKTAQVSVAQNITSPVANAGNTFVLDCFGETDYLDGTASTGTAALTYAWETFDGSIVSGANTAGPAINEPGTYLLTVTNTINGCTDTAQVTITRDEPMVTPSVLQPLCFGNRGTIDLSTAAGGQSPYLYSVNGGSTFTTSPVFSSLPAGQYAIVVQDSRGCETAQSALIVQPNELVVKVASSVSLMLGDTYQMNTQVNYPAEEIAQVTWFPATGLSCTDCLNPVATPTATTLYKVTVVTKNGCEETAIIILRVDKRGGVYVPSAFSPNGDGTNDLFMVFADPASVVKIKSFLVFSRWGETVFEYFNFTPNDPAFGWDGNHRGSPLNPGVFTWSALVEFIDGRIELLSGDVILVK
jgi:gliding motility-associated-like protein